MRRVVLFGVIILMIFLPACQRTPAGGERDLDERDSDRQDAVQTEDTVICEEYFEPEAEEPEPEEAEIEYEDSVASITPDFWMDIREKEAENPDTVGWLYIPDTTVNQVVVQNPPEMENNQFYLDVDFDRIPDKNGTFCADFRNAFISGARGDLSRITTIYGHSWSDDPDGILFEQLKKFKNPEFARTHPYIFFSTEDENMAWEVFAVFDVKTDLPYITPDLDDNQMHDLLDTVDKLSEYSYASAVSPDDKLLALSTCTYSVRGHELLPEYNDYRFVVMAKLVGPNSPKLDETVFHINEDPAPPDIIPEFMSVWKSYTFPVDTEK